VTAATTRTPPPTTAPVVTPPPSPDGHTLNDQAYALMQHGNFAAALPLLQQAVQKLQGTGPTDPYEAYANYNLGFTLLQLGQCTAATPYLQSADELEPHNPQVHRALKSAGRCGEAGNRGKDGSKKDGEH